MRIYCISSVLYKCCGDLVKRTLFTYVSRCVFAEASLTVLISVLYTQTGSMLYSREQRERESGVALR